MDLVTREARIEQARRRAALHAPPIHRAGPDAYFLRAVYLELRDGQTGLS
jgi:hypothetical protein